MAMATLLVERHHPSPLLVILREIGGEHLVEQRQVAGELRIGVADEADDARVGEQAAQAAQGGHRHDHVAELIHALDEDAPRRLGEQGAARGADLRRALVDLLRHGARIGGIDVDDAIDARIVGFEARRLDDDRLVVRVPPVARVGDADVEIVAPRRLVAEIDPSVEHVFAKFRSLILALQLVATVDAATMPGHAVQQDDHFDEGRRGDAEAADRLHAAERLDRAPGRPLDASETAKLDAFAMGMHQLRDRTREQIPLQAEAAGGVEQRRLRSDVLLHAVLVVGTCPLDLACAQAGEFMARLGPVRS